MFLGSTWSPRLPVVAIHNLSVVVSLTPDLGVRGHTCGLPVRGYFMGARRVEGLVAS